MRPAHVRVLACLRCGGPLTLSGSAEADGHVMTGALSCASCASSYPITRGVARLVPGARADAVENTVEAFGYQWQQATDILAHARFSHPDVFLDFIRPVQADWFQGKTVLDAGCGSGRFVLLSAQFGAGLVVGLDLSDAVDLAFERTRHLDGVCIVQGDLLALPLQRAFDYAFSVGVLHHTADPRGAFLQVAGRVVPGGSMSAWVYGAENNGWVLRVLNPVRRVTSRLPRRVLLGLAYVAAAPITIAAKGVYRPVARRASLAWLRRRLFYFDYFVFLSQFGYREHVFIVFDHAVPEIAEYIPRDVFAEWFSAGGLERVTITDRAGNSWRGFGMVA